MSNHIRQGELCPACNRACGEVRLRSDVRTVVSNGGVMSGRGCPRCRLMRRVEITPTCWLWTGTKSVDKTGPTYGQFMLNGRRMGAHRASYIIHVGPIDDSLDCMHSCDVKACVNPAHLSPGTRSQNLLDGFAANPGVCAGENNGRARLDWPRVRAIRASRAAGVPQADLAAQYGVTQSHISQIVRGLKWPEPTQAEAVA